jgi:hypothetical protein
MKTLILSSLTAAAVLAGVAGASAQTVVITEQQAPVIREYVVRQNVTPIQPVENYDFVIGSTVPDVVELHPVELPEMSDRYEYVVTNDGRTVLVEPGTRRVVQFLD